MTGFSTDIKAKYYPDNKDNVYVHMKTDQKIIALTFDDGPHPTKTDEILNVLSKYNVKATFFVIGENAVKYPQVLKKVAMQGHEIGNHTFDHKSIYKLHENELQSSVKRCEECVEEIIGKKPRCFRPPEGFMNDEIATKIKETGYDVILWKIDTYDWKGRSASDIYKTVVDGINCGDIILMHDYIWRTSYTAKALDMIIPKLKDMGYSFVTVSEAISK